MIKTSVTEFGFILSKQEKDEKPTTLVWKKETYFHMIDSLGYMYMFLLQSEAFWAYFQQVLFYMAC